VSVRLERQIRRQAAALRELAGELQPLLVEMTGQIVIRHLEQILELRERDLFVSQEERK